MTDQFIVEPLSPRHDKGSFDCGVAILDRYLHALAAQDVRRRLANCFVAVGDDERTIRGFYTLTATATPLGDLPEDVTRRLPHYPAVPAVLVGRLAVDRRHQRAGLGAALLADAAMRAARSEPAVHTLLVDAKDESAAEFYRLHGFRPLRSQPRSLFLPLGTAGALPRKGR